MTDGDTAPPAAWGRREGQDGHPGGAHDPAGVVDDGRQQLVDGVGPHQLGGRLERVEPGVVHRLGDRPHLLDAHAVDLADLDHEQVDQLVVGQLDHELVDGLAAVAFEDVDPHDVAADGTDPACHLSQRPGAIRQPHAEDEGRHGEGTYARVVNASFRAHNRNVSALRDGPLAARHAARRAERGRGAPLRPR